jgi:hypothetical protein
MVIIIIIIEIVNTTGMNFVKVETIWRLKTLSYHVTHNLWDGYSQLNNHPMSNIIVTGSI